MSMESYELGDQNNDLFLKMNVGTAGIAVSAVYCNNGTSNYKLASSEGKSGNINEISVGKTTEFRNNQLHFSTNIDLINLNPKNWEQEAKICVVTLELKGGKNGPTTFKMNPEELIIIDDGRTLLFNKYIKLS